MRAQATAFICCHYVAAADGCACGQRVEGESGLSHSSAELNSLLGLTTGRKEGGFASRVSCVIRLSSCV